MQIGLINQIHGRPNADSPAPTWASIRERAVLAEQVGFDIFVYEDVLMYKGEEATNGVWESVAISGAIAEATSTIRFGQSVINSPYRSPAMTVSIAETLAEISGNRYVLGIGAGNSPDSDYAGFGFPRDHRYSRFAEAIEIIHTLARTGTVDFDGEYYTADGAEIVLRGSDGSGPYINIAAGGVKMMDLVARYGDAWNWWTWDLDTQEGFASHLEEPIRNLVAACEAIGRDPHSVIRTIDVYSVVPPGGDPGDSMDHPISGTPEQIATTLLGLTELGVSEVRVDLTDKTPAAIEAMAPVVELVHAG